MNSLFKYWLCIILLIIVTFGPVITIVLLCMGDENDQRAAGAATPPVLLALVLIMKLWAHALLCPSCDDWLGWKCECRFNQEFDYGLSEEAGDERCPPHPWYAKPEKKQGEKK